jgi:Transcriptional regulator, AbiEi antitoxin, Type IV TA system
LVSTPGRAILELLSDVGKAQGMAEARDLVEAVRGLRPALMDELVHHLKRIKVARLAHKLAEELDLPWQAMARANSERLGGGKRWVCAGRTGEWLNLKRPM